MLGASKISMSNRWDSVTTAFSIMTSGAQKSPSTRTNTHADVRIMRRNQEAMKCLLTIAPTNCVSMGVLHALQFEIQASRPPPP